MEQKRFPKFAERFAELRGNRTQDEFSVFLGISRPTVGFYENGTRLPDALVLRQICERCQVSADWLLGLSDEKSLNGEISQVCNYTGLNRSAIETLTDLKDSDSGCRSIIASYILSDDDFFSQIIEYLIASIWDSVDSRILGKYPPSEKEKKEYENERKANEGTFKFTMPPMWHDIYRPDTELTEALMFASIIKDLPRLFDRFKQDYAGNKDFIDAVVRDYVKNEKEWAAEED